MNPDCIAHDLARILLLSTLAIAFAFSSGELYAADMAAYYTEALRDYGFETDTAEHILLAREHRSYFVRYAVLYVLAARVGQEAVPTLIDALTDQSPDVRIEAAHILGTLGNRAGLERMRKDMEELAPSRGVPPVESNLPATLREQSAKLWRHNLGLALRVAKVLAELGDIGGYELAERIALDQPALAAWYRSLAISALGELAKLEKNSPTEHFHPTLALCALAASESDPFLLKRIRTATVGLDPIQTLDILTIAKDNPHQPPDQLRQIRSTIARLQKQ